jgi:hypothetical protein
MPYEARSWEQDEQEQSGQGNEARASQESFGFHDAAFQAVVKQPVRSGAAEMKT